MKRHLIALVALCFSAQAWGQAAVLPNFCNGSTSTGACNYTPVSLANPFPTTATLSGGTVTATSTATAAAALPSLSAGAGNAFYEDLHGGLFTSLEVGGSLVTSSAGLPVAQQGSWSVSLTGNPNVNINQVSGNALPNVGSGIVPTAPTPTSASAAGITPVSSGSVESSHVLKSSAGNLYSAYVTTGGSAGYLMTFNATSAPADGAVTPVDCIEVPASATTGITVGDGPPDAYSTGITVVFSTTGCFTKTASATAFFKGRIQ